MSGPMPKRSEERVRRNTSNTAGMPLVKIDDVQARKMGVDLAPRPPEPDESWDPRVLALWEALEVSPGVIFMYAADWQMAYQLCEQLDRAIKPQFVGFEDHWNSEAQQMEHLARRERIPMNGSQLSALMKGFNQLGLTEEARRRMNFEAPALEVGPEFQEPTSDPGVVLDYEAAQASRRRGLLG